VSSGAVTLDRLGWGTRDEPVRSNSDGEGLSRVAVEHRGAYTLLGPHGELEASVDTGLRDSAADDRGFPTVGDWVRHSLAHHDDRRVNITAILERRSAVVRRAPGHEPVPQVVAANVDVLGIVTSPDEDLNERRLERYLVTALGSGARPLVIVNKIDLVEGSDLPSVDGVGDAEVISTSAATGEGFEHLEALLERGITLAFTGSSGVGKSSIVNRLLGDEVLATGEVRRDGRGRHTTVRRELLLAPSHGVVIDTPGLREIRLWDDGGLDRAFPEIVAAAAGCRFDDCRHESEPGCGVRSAVESGEITTDRHLAYTELEAELFELAEEREDHERRQRRRRDARARPGRRIDDEDLTDR